MNAVTTRLTQLIANARNTEPASFIDGIQLEAKIEAWEVAIKLIEEYTDDEDNPASQALDDLWKAIILKNKPDYGDWEYPGQAYRHLLAEYKDLEWKATTTVKPAKWYQEEVRKHCLYRPVKALRGFGMSFAVYNFDEDHSNSPEEPDPIRAEVLCEYLNKIEDPWTRITADPDTLPPYTKYTKIIITQLVENQPAAKQGYYDGYQFRQVNGSIIPLSLVVAWQPWPEPYEVQE